MRFGGRRNPSARLRLPIHAEFVNKCMQDQPDMSAKTLAEKIKEEFNITLSTSKMNAYRTYLGWKQGNTRYCQLIRDVNKDKRKQWCELQLRNAEQFDVSIVSMLSPKCMQFQIDIVHLSYLCIFIYMYKQILYVLGCDFHRRVSH